MKKNIFTILFVSFVQLIAFGAIQTTAFVHEFSISEEEFVKFVSKNERKSTYQIQLNQIKSDAERASFMEGLFASTTIVVISRPDENGMLKITAAIQFTTEQVKQEIQTILIASKSKPSLNVLKNK